MTRKPSKRTPRKQTIICEWFLLCDRPAVGYTPHPILAMVPTCERCHKFATGELTHTHKLAP